MQRNSKLSPTTTVDATRLSLIDELEAAVAQRNIGSRADVLRRITDLFAAGSDEYNAEQMALFEDVMSRLVSEVELSARAAFGEKLATIKNAPSKILQLLALDDAIEVAGPMLTHSDRVDEETLIVGAKTKSQEHLYAISQRKTLSEGVTDVLVERGDQKVVISTAANTGARFSNFGCSKLVERSIESADLALAVWSRNDIPREHLLALVEAASETVQREFELADRGKAALIRNIVRQASDQLQTKTRAYSVEFIKAQEKVRVLHGAGLLTEEKVCEFARTGQFDETTVALSLMADLPVGAIERILVNEHDDQIILVAKSICLSWETTKLVIAARAASCGRPIIDLEQLSIRFQKLKPQTAQTAIQFYRLRERSVGQAFN